MSEIEKYTFEIILDHLSQTEIPAFLFLYTQQFSPDKALVTAYRQTGLSR